MQDRSMGERRLNSGILGASVANLSITELQDDVVIHLKNTEPVPVSLFLKFKLQLQSIAVTLNRYMTLPFPKLQGNFVAKCVFWDFTLNGKCSNKI